MMPLDLERDYKFIWSDYKHVKDMGLNMSRRTTNSEEKNRHSRKLQFNPTLQCHKHTKLNKKGWGGGGVKGDYAGMLPVRTSFSCELICTLWR